MASDGAIEVLTRHLAARKRTDRPLVVGINGIDGSGKTTFAAALADALAGTGASVCRISIDGFHHPRAHRYRRGADSPEGYYRDSFRYDVFAEQALRPAALGERFPARCQTRAFDLDRDAEDPRFVEIGAGHVIIAEGVFLFRPEIFPLLQVPIFLDVGFETILERVVLRDGARLGGRDAVLARYKRRYIPGQRLYFAECDPKGRAEIVIDNDDPASPRILRLAAP